MKRVTGHGPGLLATVGGVVALLCVSLSGSTGALSVPQTRHVHTVADRTEHRGDGGGDDGPGHPLNINRSRPGAAVSGLAKSFNDVALLAPPPIRPGTAKRTGSTPIVSNAVRPGVVKPAPRLVGVDLVNAGARVGGVNRRN